MLAEYELRDEEAAAQGGRKSVAVAVRQGPLLATAFHPELTKDLRWYVPRLLCTGMRLKRACC